MSEGPPESSFADVLNGITGSGARRKSTRRRGFLRRDPGPEDDPQAEEPGPVPPAAGAPPGSDRGDDTHTVPQGLDLPTGRHELADSHPDAGGEPDSAAIVRPYAWTRGRTRPAYDLGVETLVSTTAEGRDPQHVRQYEHRAVADLCREPRSVAEVGALLGLPLGVARVLLGDMASQGTVVVHETAASVDDVPDMALMERVLSGLRRL